MNLEIIPNWHPIFVHFSIALLSISSALLIIGKLAPQKYLWRNTALTVSRWNLLIGATISIATVLAGWYAYNTVSHDEPSHIAMTSHMKWALSTFSLFVVVAAWSFFTRKKETGTLLAAFQLFATLILLVTGFKGGELVYRHGLGVLSLPEAEGNEEQEHTHKHGSEHKNDSAEKNTVSSDNTNDEKKAQVTKKSVSKKLKTQNKDAAVNNETKKESGHNHNHGDHE